MNPVLLDKFFNQLEDDVSQIVQRDKHREQYSNSAGHEVNNSSEQEQVRKLTRSLFLSQRQEKIPNKGAEFVQVCCTTM